jgi:hypothetical protein
MLLGSGRLVNWIVGDIHGQRVLLESLLTAIKAKDAAPTIYCVGDLCDRGPDTKGVVDIVLREGIKCARGNHDDVMDCILTRKPTPFGEERGKDAPFASLSWFLRYGMFDTFGSYGAEREKVYDALKGERELAELVALVPKEHHDFFRSQPVIIDAGDFFVVHASLPPEIELSEVLPMADEQNPSPSQMVYGKAMIWGRYNLEQVNQKKAWGKKGYFGHTPTSIYGDEYKGKPIFGDNIALVDTGAFKGDGLTAICHETQEVITV